MRWAWWKKKVKENDYFHFLGQCFYLEMVFCCKKKLICCGKKVVKTVGGPGGKKRRKKNDYFQFLGQCFYL